MSHARSDRPDTGESPDSLTQARDDKAILGLVPLAALTPVLEAAIVVARADEAGTPARTAPAELRHFLRFSRLPKSALGQVRRVMEHDDAFRERVLEVLTESGSSRSLGRAAHVELVSTWLARPPGWRESLAEMLPRTVGEQGAVPPAHGANGASRVAPARAQNTTSPKVEKALAAARADRAQAAEALSAAKAERAAARSERRRVAAELAAVQSERADLLARVESTEAELFVARAVAAELREELDSVERSLRMARRENEILRRQAAKAELEQADAVARGTREMRTALAGAMELAERLRSDLVAALAHEEFVLEVDSAAYAPQRPSSRSGARRRGRRVAMRPPPGLDEHSLQTVAAWCEAPGLVVLLDGYNVAHALSRPQGSRPAATDGDVPARLRASLTALLSPWATRSAAEIVVVFDGVTELAASDAGRTPFSVVFSRGRNADDEIVVRIESVAADRPVVVVTADRDLATRVARVGGNVVAPDTFIELLRRR